MLSQMELATPADISPRHLSLIEIGRSVPSREAVLCLAEALGLELRERNPPLLAAGYAPVGPARGRRRGGSGSRGAWRAGRGPSTSHARWSRSR
ncbi:helix-turn-helix domain-containing protein [Streptomyces violascens]|uniref:helix-turn-helix domain-containing protein n=1 Tax=Streptomyces violascens TaxID=67381 RepID=UPI00365C1D13